MKASLENLRPMGAQDILDVAFRLYRSNFWLLVKIYAVLYVPCNVGLAIIVPFVGQNSWLIPLAVLLYLTNAALVWVASCAVVKAISATFLEEKTDLKSVYQFVLPKMVMLSVTLLLYSIALFAVIMVCLLPGMLALVLGNKVVGGVLLAVGMLLGLFLFFLVGVWFLFVTQACALENRGYFSAFNRSQQLVSGYFWKVAGTMILAFLIVLVVQIATMIPVGILAGIGMYSSASTSQVPPVWNSVMALSNIIYNTLLYPFLGIVMTLLYYDLRIRKEGFDLEMMAQEAGYGSVTGTSIGDGSTTSGAAGGE